MNRMRHALSLRWLIGGIYFSIMVCLLGAFALYFSQKTEEDYMGTMSRTLRGQAKLGADLLAIQTLAPNKALHTLRRIHVRTGARRVTLITLDGTIIAESPINASRSTTLPYDPEIQQAFLDGVGEDVRFNAETSEETLFIAVPVLVRETKPITGLRAQAGKHPPQYTPRAILILATPITEIKEAIGRINTAIGFAFLGVLLVLFFLNAAVSNFVSQPLATLSVAAERFACGTLDERVSPAGAAEIVSLGESFNRMAEQLRLTISRLEQERAQAEAMLTSMVDALLVTDTQGLVVLANPSASEFFEQPHASVLGKMLTEVTHNEELEALWQTSLTTHLPLKQELTLSQPLARVVEVHMAPVEVGLRHLGVVIVLYDITHQRQLEQMRRDFVANVSHELRTPVASIRAMAETLEAAYPDDPELVPEFLRTIIGESERLTALLDDLLQLARIESGRRLLAPRTLELSAIIRHVVERLLAPITAKGHHVHLEVPAQLWLTADPDVLVQILVNLLDNARKYSPDGSHITVRAECDGTAVRLTVSDTGLGIPPGDSERIFERFYRVEKARSRALGGTGLGLAIVKHLVELLEGHILVESELGRGSAFTVEWPYVPPVAGDRDDGEPPLPGLVASTESGS